MIPPQYFSDSSRVSGCIIGDGTEVFGEIYNSVIGSGVVIEAGARVVDSIIMSNTVIGRDSYIEKAIIAENSVIGSGAQIGVFPEAENHWKPNVYSGGLVTIGEDSIIPPEVRIGKNVAILGKTVAEDYPEGILASGESIIKA